MNNEEMEDRLFEETVEASVPSSDREKAFYTKVAGASHQNDDGSSRTQIIKKCKEFECLNLIWEQDNKFDSNAVAVRRVPSGEQLGYLETRLAGEVVREMGKRGPCWTALFRQPTHHPESGMIVGAVLYMICFSDNYLEKKVVAASHETR